MAVRVQGLIDLITKDTPVNHSILIVGQHASAKSAIVFQCGKILDCPVVDFRLSQNDVGDMKGMPFHVQGRTFFAPPEWFPITEEDASVIKKLLNTTEEISLGKYGPRGILFLDEINRGVKEARQCCFQLVNDRKLNNRSLPDGWRVIAAVNPTEDCYDVNEMDAAFISRFVVVDFQPSKQDWFRWADANGVHDAVIKFLSKFPELMDPTPELLAEASAAGIKIVHNRRSWDRYSQLLNKMEAEYKAGTRPVSPLNKSKENLERLLELATTYVGYMAASKFMSFVEADYNSLTADMILNGWNKDVAEQLAKVTKSGVITEIGRYNEDIIAYTKRIESGVLTKVQKENLTKYLKAIDNEPRSDFWIKWLAECKEMATLWLSDSPENGELTVVTFKKKSKT